MKGKAQNGVARAMNRLGLHSDGREKHGWHRGGMVALESAEKGNGGER